MSQKGFIPILIVVILAAASVGGYLVYQNSNKPTPQPTVQPIIQPTPQPSPTLDETTNWETYTNTTYKFSFLYPPDWDYSVGLSGTDIIFKPINVNVPLYTEAQMPVLVTFYREKYEDAVKRLTDAFSESQKIENISIAGLNGIHVSGTISSGQAQGISGGSFILNKDAKALEFDYEVISGRNYMNEARKMVESLKFLDQQSPVPSGLNTDLPKVVEYALEDLANMFKVDKTSIKVLEIEEKEWSDSSLGCPKPGFVYAQVLTPGYKVIFTFDHPLAEFQKRYEYHTDRTNNFIRCDS